MQQKDSGLNTIINIIVAVFAVMLVSIGYFLFDQHTSWNDIYQGVFKITPILQQNEFKTIEVMMYNQAPENISAINTQLKKFHDGKIVLEILNVTNTTSKIIHKKVESSTIKETNNVDLTIKLNVAAQKKDNKYYFENKELKLGSQLSADFGTVFLNGTIQRVT